MTSVNFQLDSTVSRLDTCTVDFSEIIRGRVLDDCCYLGALLR